MNTFKLNTIEEAIEEGIDRRLWSFLRECDDCDAGGQRGLCGRVIRQRQGLGGWAELEKPAAGERAAAHPFAQTAGGFERRAYSPSLAVRPQRRRIFTLRRARAR